MEPPRHGGLRVGWTPAQVARYLGLVRLWADATPWSANTLNGMLAQAARIGTAANTGFVVAAPLNLVPVIAIGQPLKNPRVASRGAGWRPRRGCRRRPSS